MKRIAFWGVIILINLMALEFLAYGFARQFSDIVYSPRDNMAAYTDMTNYRKYLERYWNADAGWENPKTRRKFSRSCLGDKYTLHFDRNRARKTPVSGPPKILFFGDSFTLGKEVEDEETYPSRIAETLNIPVANHGVSASGPVSATFLMTQKAALYPKAEVAVLGVMYENIRRARNIFRAALSIGHQHFAYKPGFRFEGGKAFLVENPNRRPVRSKDALRALALQSFKEDYWTPEPGRFPYLLSVIRAFGRDQAVKRFHEEKDKILGRPMYRVYYEDEAFHQILLAVVERFIRSAQKRNLKPLIAFIPRSWNDRESPERLIALINNRHGGTVAFNVGRADLDWKRYTLRDTVFKTKCHPSPYGQQGIADFLAPKLRALLDGR